MSNLEEIEAAVPKLSQKDLASFRAWFEDYCEDRLELKDEVRANLDEARKEIHEGKYRSCFA